MTVTATILDVAANLETFSYDVKVSFTDGTHTQQNVYTFSPDTPITQVQKVITIEGKAIAARMLLQTQYEATVAGGKKPFEAYIGTSFQVA